MFWDKGYLPSQNIEALLEKENATVEEFLDDEDILLECKSQKKSIVNYFIRPDVVKRLVELIITEPSDELPMAQRFRYANMACEILTLGLPSLDEKLLSDEHTLKTLYSYLENKPPLNPLLASFFSKTFSMLFTKKAEQDWFLYQQMCLQLLEFIKRQKNFLDLICMHFSTPVIPDLIMQMMRDVEGGQLKRNLYEWLTEDKLVERLISIFGNPKESDKHSNVAEFLCDLIQQGRSMRQTEYENDSFEPAFDGSNPILQTIESEATIEALLNVILEANAQESAIVSGITVVLTLIKPAAFVDEPNSDRLKFIQNREKEIHEQILATVIRVIAPRLKDFNELLRNPPNKPDIVTTAAILSPPFGMTRLQVCRLFTVLLQTNNEEVSKAICETDFFENLLDLFKKYSWNNFLHSEVEKCLHLVFYTQLSNNNNNSTQGSTIIVNDVSFNKNVNNTGDDNAVFIRNFVFKSDDDNECENKNESGNNASTDGKEPEYEEKSTNEMDTSDAVAAGTVEEKPEEKSPESVDKGEDKAKNEGHANADGDAMQVEKSEGNEEKSNEGNDTTKVQAEIEPSALQTHVIVNCKLISKLIDCWQHNKEIQSAEKGRRLGYMGHLINIFKYITQCISESEHIGALIENNLSNDATQLESELWQSIINSNDGDLTMALATQSKMLANCNAHDGDFSQHLPKDFLNDNNTWDYIMSSNIINNLDNVRFDDFGPIYGTGEEDDDDDDDENTIGGGGGIGDGSGHSLFGKTSTSTSALHTFGVTNNPWDSMDPFSDMTSNSNQPPWALDFNNFADFEAHFGSFTNDLGESLLEATKERNAESNGKQRQSLANNEFDSANKANFQSGNGDDEKRNEEYDNNANFEKSLSVTLGDIKRNIVSSNNDAVNDDDNTKKNNVDDDDDRVTSAIVRTLQSVMHDSEDDYEDDEGMWTKPLGGDSASALENEATNELATASETATLASPTKTTTSPVSIPNGPSSNATANKIHELFNNTNASYDTLNAVDTAETVTVTEASEKISSNMAKDLQDLETEKKLPNKATVANTTSTPT